MQACIQQAPLPDIPHASSRGQTTVDGNFGSSEIRSRSVNKLTCKTLVSSISCTRTITLIWADTGATVHTGWTADSDVTVCTSPTCTASFYMLCSRRIACFLYYNCTEKKKILRNYSCFYTTNAKEITAEYFKIILLSFKRDEQSSLKGIFGTQ